MTFALHDPAGFATAASPGWLIAHSKEAARTTHRAHNTLRHGGAAQLDEEQVGVCAVAGGAVPPWRFEPEGRHGP